MPTNRSDLGRLTACVVLATAASACGDLTSGIPERPEAPDTAARTQPYPDLADVPERPTLTYSVEQRRAIESRLAADRANARYEGDRLRYDTGRAPPPPSDPTIEAALEAVADPPTEAPSRPDGGEEPLVQQAAAPPAASPATTDVPDLITALKETAGGELKAAAAAVQAARASSPPPQPAVEPASIPDTATTPAPPAGTVEPVTATPPPMPAPQPAAVPDLDVEERVVQDLRDIDAEGTLSDFLDILERSQERRLAESRRTSQPASLADVAALAVSGPAGREALAPELPPVNLPSAELAEPSADATDALRAPAASPPPEPAPARAGPAPAPTRLPPDGVNALALAQSLPAPRRPAEAPAVEEDAAALAPSPAAPPARTLAEQVMATPVLSLPRSGPVRLRFAADSASLSRETEALLKLVANDLPGEGTVEVVAEGATPALALDRARAVAVRLVQGGVAGDRVRMKTGGAGNGATVYRPDGGA